jgi:hypothetical protein
MTAETDKFVVASFALWAGDFEYFEELLRGYSNPSDVKSIEGGAESPEDFIRATGALRLRQLRQKRGEFKKLTREYGRQGAKLTDKPTVMETKHLRATLWRTGAREFLLQGYLTELSWQDGLFSRARHLAAANEHLKSKNVSPTSDAVEELDVFESTATRKSFTGSGTAWVVAENPFIQVELTDLGLIEATGIWIERELPDAAASITQPFLRLLQGLDDSNQST